MTYHLSRNGQPTGTCSKEEAIARYSRGEILPTDLVWCEGMANWTPASQVFGTSVPPAAPAPATTFTAPATPPAVPPAGKPSNNLIFAILVTLLCCLPFGIVAIVYAAQVDSKWATGDHAGAFAAAKNAQTWCWVSLIAWIVGIVGYIGFMVVMGVSAGAFAH